MRSTLYGLLTAVVVFFGGLDRAEASDASESLTEAQPLPAQIIALGKGDRAPFSGMLIEQDDLVRWRLEIEGLQYRLDAEVRRVTNIYEAKLELERTRTRAAHERAELRDELWQDRVNELAMELQLAREDAEPTFWESPLLWFGMGVVVSVVATVALASSL